MEVLPLFLCKFFMQLMVLMMVAGVVLGFNPAPGIGSLYASAGLQ